MDIFEECSVINDLLQADEGIEARNRLIRLLDSLGRENQAYNPLLNHLIRESGLYPYLEPETSSWQDRFVFESFKVDIGQDEPVTLHSEQSLVLKHLLDGDNLAVSAPTSFGKSLIIDAYIAIRRKSSSARKTFSSFHRKEQFIIATSLSSLICSSLTSSTRQAEHSTKSGRQPS